MRSFSVIAVMSSRWVDCYFHGITCTESCDRFLGQSSFGIHRHPIFPQFVFAQVNVCVPCDRIAAGFNLDVLEKGGRSQGCKHGAIEQWANVVGFLLLAGKFDEESRVIEDLSGMDSRIVHGIDS